MRLLYYLILYEVIRELYRSQFVKIVVMYYRELEKPKKMFQVLIE